MTNKCKAYLKVNLILFIISLLLFVICIFSKEIAEFCSVTVSATSRFILSLMSSILPFSLSEVLVVVGVPSLLVYLTYIIVSSFKNKENSVSFHLRFLSGTALLFASLYILNIGICYHRLPLEENLGLKRAQITKAQLYEGASIIRSELETSAENVSYDNTGASVMPYSFNELSKKLDRAYDKLIRKYSFISNCKADAKIIALSKYMTYTHISGIYMPITGEANVNTNYPDYVVAFSTAHEKAHQRGIAGEDEANFVAYLACICSDDEYIKYSALMSMYEYYLSAAADSDSEMYSLLITETSGRVLDEMRAYYEFFKIYSNSGASKIADKVNDTHLKLQGQEEGTRSYGLVVELCEAYRIQKKETP